MFVPWYFWGETLWIAYFVPALLRYTLVLNATWLVNSAAHMWGNRPYDISINPRENRWVTFSAIGVLGIFFSGSSWCVETGRSLFPGNRTHSNQYVIDLLLPEV